MRWKMTGLIENVPYVLKISCKVCTFNLKLLKTGDIAVLMYVQVRDWHEWSVCVCFTKIV